MKTSLQLFVLAATISVVLVASFLFHRQRVNSLQTHADDQPAVSDKSKELNQNTPVRLKIPRLHIDAAVESVGVMKDGEMDVPKNIANAGWFNLGSIPGDHGSAVIAGHLDGPQGESGVFMHLNTLEEGDTFTVENSSGKVLTFIVRKKSSYSPGYADEVFGLNDSAHLNLITCEGRWDPLKKTYSKRLVVFTDLKSEDEK